jgi:predicted amidohydrolase
MRGNSESNRRLLRVSLVQIGFDESQTMSGQIARVAALISRHQNTDLVVLPEMWLHGAFAAHSWREKAIDLDGSLLDPIAAAAHSASVNVLAGSFVERAGSSGHKGRQGRGLWNTSVLFDRDGDVSATYRKIHRFGFGDGEPEVIEAGDRVVTASLLGVGGEPLCVIGLATCYDLRFPELFRVLVDHGAEVMVVPAAWPLARVAHWQALGIARAIENQAFILQVNDCGDHSGMAMAGHSQVVDPSGGVLALGERDEVTLRAELDLQQLVQLRQSFPVLRDRRLAVTGEFVVHA